MKKPTAPVTIPSTTSRQIVIDLTYPPSVNGLWRSTGARVYRSPKYIAWIAENAWAARAQAGKQPSKQIEGDFTLLMLAARPDARRRDLDNIMKACLDFCERTIGIVKNDCNCIELTAKWVPESEAPTGVRLYIDEITR